MVATLLEGAARNRGPSASAAGWRHASSSASRPTSRRRPNSPAARQAIAAIARYVLLPSLALVLVTGLLAIAATRGYHDAGWAWVKALLGIGVFEATLVTVGAEQPAGRARGGSSHRPEPARFAAAFGTQHAVAAAWIERRQRRARRVAAEADDQDPLIGWDFQRRDGAFFFRAIAAAPNISTAPSPSAQPKLSPSATTPTVTAITGLTNA